MDVPMQDANRRGGGGRRNGPANARAARRSDPYARDSRARPNAAAAAAAAPRDQNSAASAGTSYAPPELSIRGSSGPTWIVVSNLVAGTSLEDVRLTFGMFGRVEEVKQRPPPSANHPTVSFEVAFDKRENAESAAEKFNGALADGRILQVSIKKPETPRDAYSQFNRATAQAVAQRPREKAANLIPAPAALPYTPTPAAAVTAAIPTGPASMRSRANTARLVEPRAKQSNVAAGAQKNAPAIGKASAANNNTGKNKNGKVANAAAVPAGPKKATGAAAAKPQSLAQRIPEPLANRLLTQEQAQKLRAEEAKKKAKDEARAKAIAATGKHTVLGKRLGGLPLAQRLVQSAGTPKSDQSAIRAAAEKKKRKRDAAKAKKTKKSGAAGSGMDLDG
ncbi:ER lumen protein-retaining receptor [Pseudozyma hubeiensis]|nr:ER lumen protein-retaining receptor [Pseudozyma hubeiensis]